MMEVALWILLMTVFFGSKSVYSCTFPEAWRGSWYQHGLGDIDITRREIKGKGICFERSGSKFLLSHRAQKCFKCLVITKWHTNVLQYKESYCQAEDSLESVCNNINGDAPLRTIVRVHSVPVPCPFRGYYTFSYQNNTNTRRPRSCDSPRSEIHACADESKFKFKYKKCAGMPETYDREVNFQCLATWENGEKYLYGQFLGPNHVERKDSYRCFMHSFYGSMGEMSMSADPTCQGLQSPDIGVYTMNLDYDGTKWPLRQCRFPDFFTHRKQWRDLTGRYRVIIDNGLQIFRLQDKYPIGGIYSGNELIPEMKMVVRCVEEIEGLRSSHTIAEYLIHVIDDQCSAKHRCLRLKKRHHDVIELQIGSELGSANTACSEIHFAHGQRHLLIPKVEHPSKCPAFGDYDFVDQTSDCNGQFMIGCRSTSELEIVKRCPVNRQSVDIMKCLINWKEHDSHYVIVEKYGSIERPATCLAFTSGKNGIEVQEDEFCEKSTMISKKFINYVLTTEAGDCRDLPQPTRGPNDMSSAEGSKSINDNDSKRNTYDGSSAIIDAGGNSAEKTRATCVFLFVTVFTYVMIER